MAATGLVRSTSAVRMPVLAVGHGPGPAFVLPSSLTSFFSESGADSLTVSNLKKVPDLLPSKPKAIVIVSAHWEGETVAEVSKTSEASYVHVNVDDHPKLLYDYYGMPKESYSVRYDAPGSRELGEKVVSLLDSASFPSKAVKGRGWDHGVFIPLKTIFPDADIPVVAVSLHPSLDASIHIELGKALAPLRNEDVLIVASGSPTHSFREMGNPKDATPKWASDFESWLYNTLKNSSDPKLSESALSDLVHWESRSPQGRRAHPREEHLLPFHVAAGAASVYPTEPSESKKVNDQWAFGTLSLATYLLI